jgi:hypothetical protein
MEGLQPHVLEANSIKLLAASSKSGKISCPGTKNGINYLMTFYLF